MDDNSQNRLTTGSVPRKMLLFALPIFLSNLFQQLYNAVDSLIVGQFIGQQAPWSGPFTPPWLWAWRRARR